MFITNKYIIPLTFGLIFIIGSIGSVKYDLNEIKLINNVSDGCIFDISYVFGINKYTHVIIPHELATNKRICIKDAKTSTNFTICEEIYCIDRSLCDYDTICENIINIKKIASISIAIYFFLFLIALFFIILFVIEK